METLLYKLISTLYREIDEMTPEDGFSSPRDIILVTEVNKKAAILSHLRKAMEIINPGFTTHYDIEGSKC